MAPEHYMSLLSFLESVSIDRINTIPYLTRWSDEEVDTVSGWGLKSMRSESAGFY